MMQLVLMQLSDWSEVIQLGSDRAGMEPSRLPLESLLLTAFLQRSICHVMVFLTPGFGGHDKTASVQQPEMGLLCLDQTISQALLGVTVINANGRRPCLSSKDSGSHTFNYGCPLHHCWLGCRFHGYMKQSSLWPPLSRQSASVLVDTDFSVLQIIFFKNSGKHSSGGKTL